MRRTERTDICGLHLDLALLRAYFFDKQGKRQEFAEWTCKLGTYTFFYANPGKRRLWKRLDAEIRPFPNQRGGLYVKRLGTICSLALMILLGMAMAPRAAHAQSDPLPELSRDWNVRIGMFIYNSKATRNAQGEVGISGMVERRVYKGDAYDVLVGIGYNGLDRVYSVPVMINLIAHKNNLRYGAGAGYSFNKRIDGSGSNGTALAVILGYTPVHGKNPISVDLRYFFLGGSSSELDGYSLTIGAQF